MEKLQDLLREIYLVGFEASGEGWNGEYPFSDHGRLPEQTEEWITRRDADIADVLTRRGRQ